MLGRVLSIVSTHSRPKAAGVLKAWDVKPMNGFNTQPPEGGWVFCDISKPIVFIVSTHSRPKAAGNSG